MSYVDRLESLIQGDFGYPVYFEIRDGEDIIVSLATKTLITIYVVEAGETTAKFTVEGEVYGDAANGICYFDVLAEHFDEGNKDYNVLVEVNFSAKKITATGASLFVKAKPSAS